MVPIQDLRKSTIITSKIKSSIEEKKNVGVELKKVLCSFLRGKTIRIRDGSMSSGENLVLSSLVRYKSADDLEERVLRIIFLSN